MISLSFHDRWLAGRRTHGGLCVGVDPHAALLAQWGLPDSAAGLREFSARCLEATVGTVAVIKPQSAFFERHGSGGLAVLEWLIAEARAAGLLMLLDAKRGDIGTTVNAYADALFSGPAAVDAATFSPYLGVAALWPAIDAAAQSSSAVILVTQSSNPEGRRLQRATTADGGSVQQSVVDEAVALTTDAGVSLGSLGFVVSPGPTGKVEVEIPPGTTVLCPGIGAQGLTPRAALDAFPSAIRESVLVSASRSILSHGPSPAPMREEIRRMQLEG